MPSNQVKPKDFLNQCIAIVCKYVECHDPLTFEVIDDTKVLYAICNTQTKISMDGQPLFYLLKVKNSKGLYLHIDTTIQAPERNASLEKYHVFEGVSIQFLQGTGRLFCRAEWDVKKKKEKLIHPQPHWHWGYEQGQEEPIKFGEDVEVQSEGGFMQEVADSVPSLPSIDFEELHYAMISKWATQDVAVEDFSVQKVYTWLKNCITSVIDQYNYQVNKSGFESSKNW